MKFIQMSLLASTMVLFTACGGGDDSNIENYVAKSWKGQFVDTYVKGLNYTCIGIVWDADGQDTGDTQITSTGVTNDKGEFTCNEGDVVEFSIGSYVIGSTYAYNNTIKSPYDLSLGSEEAVINVAQLLQTIDDQSVNGVLTIPDNFTALNNVNTPITDPDFDALMADALNVTSLVSAVDAQTHLDTTLSTLTDDSSSTTSTSTTTEAALLKTMLASQTWQTIDTVLTFNADVTMVDVNGDGQFDYTVTLDGMTLTLPIGTAVITIENDTTLIFDGYEIYTLRTVTGPALAVGSSDFFGKHIEFTGYAGKFDFTSTPEAVGYLGTYYKEDGTTVPMMWSTSGAQLRIALYNANMFWEDIAIFEFYGLTPGADVIFDNLIDYSRTEITISVFN